MPGEKFLLIDGNSLLYRAFYALPLLHTSEGIYTNGVYGFMTMFRRVMAEQQPSHVLVAFDKDRKTFRNEMYSEYKANRSATPDELQGQFQILRDLLTALNVEYREMQGYEADDIIGTVSKQAEELGIETVILTGDGDALQLVSEKVQVLMTKKGISEVELYDPAKVKAKWEVEPEKMIEIKALMGDSSDNIPGVPGVGPKTAVKLIKEFASLEKLYENLDKVAGKKLLDRLQEHREKAFMSRQLATINRQIEGEFQFQDFAVAEPHKEELLAIYQRLEFNNFITSLKSYDTAEPESVLPVVELRQLENQEDVEVFLQQLGRGSELAIYLQVDYHHPMWAKIQGVFCEFEELVYCLNVEGELSGRLEWLRPLFESKEYKKYLHNAKFAEVILMRQGINLGGIAGDTMLLAYVNDPAFDGSELDVCLLKFLNINIAQNNPAAMAALIR